MRKEAGFEVMDKIHIYAKDNDRILELMKNHKEEIMSEVLAEDMTLGTTDGYVKEWNINKEQMCIRDRGEEVDVTIEVADGDSYKEKTVKMCIRDSIRSTWNDKCGRRDADGFRYHDCSI